MKILFSNFTVEEIQFIADEHHYLLLACQLSDNVRKYTTMIEISQFDLSVKASSACELFSAVSLNGNILARAYFGYIAWKIDRVAFMACQS